MLKEILHTLQLLERIEAPSKEVQDAINYLKQIQCSTLREVPIYYYYQILKFL